MNALAHTELRGALIEALVDDAWEGHDEPLTSADLAAIADALIAGPLAPILAEWDEGSRHGAGLGIHRPGENPYREQVES